jgi:hypothetical protein
MLQYLAVQHKGWRPYNELTVLRAGIHVVKDE